jgi:hypothetical protein
MQIINTILLALALAMLLRFKEVKDWVNDLITFLSNVLIFLKTLWPKKIIKVAMFFNGKPFKQGEFMIIKDDEQLALITLQFTDSKGQLSPDKISGGAFSISDPDLGTLTQIDGVSASFVALAKLGKATLQWSGNDDDTSKALVASGDIEVVGGNVVSVSLNFGAATPQA